MAGTAGQNSRDKGQGTALSFGVFTDSHYAPGKVYGDRYCDTSIEKLKACVELFNRRELPLAINLGDIIDKSTSKEAELESLRAMVNVYAGFTGQGHHVVGNHDVATLTKKEFLKYCGVGQATSYYSFSMCGYKFIVLDANYAPNGDDNEVGNYDWTQTFVPTNQISWLAKELAVMTERKVFVATHQNLDHRLWQGSLDPHVVQNASKIRSVLENSGHVLAVLQGHYHPGHYQQINGIHYVTFRAMVVEPGLENSAYAIVNVDEDSRLTIEGFGRQGSFTLEATDTTGG